MHIYIYVYIYNYLCKYSRSLLLSDNTGMCCATFAGSGHQMDDMLLKVAA